MVDSFIPTILHILSNTLTKPFFTASLTNIEKPFFFTAHIFITKYIYWIKWRMMVCNLIGKLYLHPIWKPYKINSRNTRDIGAGCFVKCFQCPSMSIIFHNMNP